MGNCIVLVATAWGSRYGGIDSFNHDLCVALAQLQQTNLKVVCIVSEEIEDDVRKANELDVILIRLKEQAGDIEILDTLLGARNLKPEWLIGHDVHTEPRASTLSERLRVPLALFHHMNYGAYKPYQVSNTESYIKKQRETLQKAAIVLAVGPKLAESAEDKVSCADRVRKILPGLSEIREKKSKLPHRFSAITFGRLGRTTDRIKQTSLAVASFAHAVNVLGNPLGNDPEIVAVGFQENQVEEDYLKSIEAIVEEGTSQPSLLRPEGYKEEKSILLDDLCKHTVCMVLSIHEGFSLVGLEAISAEVPLILSENTGLYCAIRDAFGGKGTGCLNSIKILKPTKAQLYNESHVKPIAEKLIEIQAGKEEAKFNAEELKKMLLDAEWTWENTARTVLNELGSGKQSCASISPSTDSDSDSVSIGNQSDILEKSISFEMQPLQGNHRELQTEQKVGEIRITRTDQDMQETLKWLADGGGLDTLKKEILKRQQEISERQEKIDEIAIWIIRENPEIEKAVEWLLDAQNLAENYGKLALEQEEELTALSQKLQSDPSCLDDFYFELMQLVGLIRCSLETRKSKISGGYTALENLPPRTSTSDPGIHVRALEILKQNIPPEITGEVRTALTERIDYLKIRLKVTR
jgi:glycosyltransferase involved in cell wall biosynthesis